jgi:hypothetical protein
MKLKGTEWPGRCIVPEKNVLNQIEWLTSQSVAVSAKLASCRDDHWSRLSMPSSSRKAWCRWCNGSDNRLLGWMCRSRRCRRTTSLDDRCRCRSPGPCSTPPSRSLRAPLADEEELLASDPSLHDTSKHELGNRPSRTRGESADKKTGSWGRPEEFQKPVKDDVEFLRTAARFVQLTDQLNRLEIGVASVQPLERQRSRVGHCRTRRSSMSTAMTVKVELLLLR